MSAVDGEGTGEAIRLTCKPPPSAARAAAWALLGKVASRLLTTALLVVLARLLAPEDFGLVALAAVFVALLAVFRDAGFSPALVQRAQLRQEHLDTAAGTALAAGASFTCLGVVLAPVVASTLGQPELRPVLQLLSASFLIGALRTVPAALLMRNLAFKALAGRSIVATSLGGATGVVAALNGAGVYALVAQALVDVTVDTVMVMMATRYVPGRRVSRQAFAELWPFSSRMLATQVVNLVVRRSDDLLIGVFLGPVALGLYTVAYKLLRLIVEVSVETVSLVGLPALSRFQDDPAELGRRALKAMRITVVLCVPCFALLALTAPEIVTVLFGPRWNAAVPVVLALAVGGCVQPAYTVYVQALSAVGMPGLALRLASLNAFVGAVAFAVAVPFEIVAVAAAFSARAYIMIPPVLWAVRRHLQTPLRGTFEAFAGPVVASLTALGVGVALRPVLESQEAAQRLCLLALAFSAVCLPLLRLLAAEPFVALWRLVRRR